MAINAKNTNANKANVQPTENQQGDQTNLETDALIQALDEENNLEDQGVLTRTFDTQATIVKRLVANGAKVIKGLKVKNVNHTEQDNYDRITFSIDKGIKAMVRNEDTEEYEAGLQNLVYSSTFAIAGAFKEDESLSWIANDIIKSPTVLNPLLNGGKIDIIQIFVPAGEEYSNPFTTREDAEVNTYEEDRIFNHVIGFTIGTMGPKVLDKMLDKMMGF